MINEITQKDSPLNRKVVAVFGLIKEDLRSVLSGHDLDCLGSHLKAKRST